MRSNKHTMTLILALGFSLVPAAPLDAEPAPVTMQRQVPAHKFFDGRNIVNFSISGIMMTVDIAATNRALQVPGARELNPMGQSPAARYALKISSFGMGVGMAYAMHKTGHHKLERFIP